MLQWLFIVVTNSTRYKQLFWNLKLQRRVSKTTDLPYLKCSMPSVSPSNWWIIRVNSQSIQDYSLSHFWVQNDLVVRWMLSLLSVYVRAKMNSHVKHVSGIVNEQPRCIDESALQETRVPYPAKLCRSRSRRSGQRPKAKCEQLRRKEGERKTSRTKQCIVSPTRYAVQFIIQADVYIWLM